MDEHLSHYIWHIGIIGLAALLIYRDWRRPADTPTRWWSTVLAGLLYGFLLFCIFLEGQTVMLGLPFCYINPTGGVDMGPQAAGAETYPGLFLHCFPRSSLVSCGLGAILGRFPTIL